MKDELIETLLKLIEDEYEAVKGYTEALDKDFCEKAKERLREILADEQEHIEELQSLILNDRTEDAKHYGRTEH